MRITVSVDSADCVFVGIRGIEGAPRIDRRNSIRIDPGQSWDVTNGEAPHMPVADSEWVITVPPPLQEWRKGMIGQLKWETIENTEGDAGIQVSPVFTERARLDAPQGWLVRSWQDNKIVAQLYVPDPNDMWGK